MFPAFVGGSIAAAVGAAAWWFVAAVFSYEHAIIAWVIGGIIGYAVAKANRGEGIQAAGLLAATLAVMSITVGKYAAFQTFLPSVDTFVSDYAMVLENDTELVISYVADDVATEMEGNGRSLDWPSLPEDEVPNEKADYPPEVWKVAIDRWEDMSPQDRDTRIATILIDYEEGISVPIAEIVAEADFFSSSFGGFDILFLGLAVVTAFRIGRDGLPSHQVEGPLPDSSVTAPDAPESVEHVPESADTPAAEADR